MEQKSYEDAVGYCTKALENNPHFSKALKRRARANWEWGKWSALEASLKDCEEYLKPFPGDQEIQKLHSQLPARIELQKKRETEEMMGKLKDVGNQFLGMFGMTLDNFQMKQDPKTGSYSVQMNNEAKKNDKFNVYFTFFKIYGSFVSKIREA
ncbi:hypothetical protein BJ742DRAFT_32861 [Cladochytrium replicatum]|nr:hypothetical protein BJ742DRAFT_32861 [Cladochytrium replicatum]